LLALPRQLRAPASPEELAVMDGKEPKDGSGVSILTAVVVPSQYSLGSALVDRKTSEIPVAREVLMPQRDLTGRLVSLDALHTQDQTARQVLLEGGGDYLFTVRKNQPTLRANMQAKVAAPQADFSP
jgi:hypothetical protein